MSDGSNDGSNDGIAAAARKRATREQRIRSYNPTARFKTQRSIHTILAFQSIKGRRSRMRAYRSILTKWSVGKDGDLGI